MAGDILVLTPSFQGDCGSDRSRRAAELISLQSHRLVNISIQEVNYNIN